MEKMISYSLSRETLVLPKQDQEYELKVLDISNEELVKIYIQMIQRFYKTCFPNKDALSYEYILENIIMKPSQADYSFYITKKGETTPLAIAIVTPIPKACRISYVFTDEKYRGRGIGLFMTQSIAVKLFEKKEIENDQVAMFERIFLFADAMNPTSNGVYVRSGFKPARELVECGLQYQD